MKTVYIETSVISYLASKTSSDYLIKACQQATYTWWKDHRNRYELFTSPLIVLEASRGAPEICTPIELLEATDNEE